MILNSKRTIEKHIDMQIHNRFDIEVIDSVTGEVKSKAQAENVICNRLWTLLLGNSAKYFTHIHVGSGSGTPSSSDTSLFGFVASKEVNLDARSDTMSYSSNYTDGYFSLTGMVSFLPEDFIGTTFTEVGIGSGATAATLCTHAMFKDMNGNQISIVKTGTDLINIYATMFLRFNPNGYDNGKIRLLGFRYHPLHRDWSGVIKLLGNRTTWWNRFAFGERISNGQTVIPTANYTFDTGNKQVILTIPRIAATSDNQRALRYLALTTYNVNPIIPDFFLEVGGDWYPGKRILNESIGVGDGATTEYVTKFSFPEDGKFYINGIEKTTGVSLYKTTSFANQGPSAFFNKVDLELSTPTKVVPSMDDLEGSGSQEMRHGMVFYNPFYDIGVKSYRRTNISSLASRKLSVSDDLVNWTDIQGSTIGTHQVPTEFVHSKFWRCTITDAQNAGITTWLTDMTFNADVTPGMNIKFDTPPAVGDIITADYFTHTIAKDENHVFDVQIIFHLGEYAG